MKVTTIRESMSLFVKVNSRTMWATNFIGHILKVDEVVMYEEGQLKVYVTNPNTKIRCGLDWNDYEFVNEQEFNNFQNSLKKKDIIYTYSKQIDEIQDLLLKKGITLSYEMI